jgi:hypothetical protein
MQSARNLRGRRFRQEEGREKDGEYDARAIQAGEGGQFRLSLLRASALREQLANWDYC